MNQNFKISYLVIQRQSNSEQCDASINAGVVGWPQMTLGLVSLLFKGLAKSNVIRGQLPTCHNVHSWRLHNVAPLGNQATQSHYRDNEPTSPCPILTIGTCLVSDKHQFHRSLIWLDHGFEPTTFRKRDQCSADLATVPVSVFPI